MRKIIMGCFFIAVILFSCTNDNNNAQYQAVLQSLNSSNSFIENNSKMIYEKLEERLKDPPTRKKALLWEPKVRGVKKIVDSAELYIKQLRGELLTLAGTTKKDEKEITKLDDKNSVNQLFFKKEKVKALEDKMSWFKNEIINTLAPEEFVDNSWLRKNLQEQKERLEKVLPINNFRTTETDSPTHTQNQFTDYFKNTNVLGAMVMLAKIQNDVLNSEYIMINYFIDLTTNYTCGYEVYSAIISQNTTVLKAGEEIEIFGGMGFFTCAANPKFTIDGQIFKSDEYGTAVYKLKIKQPPGRYSIPVKVEFTKADGTQDVMIKNIKYQVLQ